MENPLLKSIIFTVLVMAAIVMPTTFVKAEVDCSLLDPRSSVSTEKEGKISASVDTLYKIAKAGGSVEGRMKDEIHNLQKGASVTEKTLIELRTLYLFCGMVANAKDITTDRKVELFNLMMKAQKKTPKRFEQKNKKKISVSNKGVVAPHNDVQEGTQPQKTSHPNKQTSISVASYGQTGGITANNVNINLQQQARVIQTIEGNIECIFSGNWKIHPGDITPMMWDKAEVYAYIYVRDAGETGAILFSLENIKMAKLPDGNLKVNIEIRAKLGTGALGSELDVLRNYSHLFVFIPFIGRDATIDNELILRKQSVSLFVNGERKSQFTDAPLTNFKIPIPEDGKAVGFWYEKTNLFTGL